MFPFSQFAMTAGIMAVVSLLLLFGARSFFKIRSPAEIILIALVAGFSVLAFRASANTTILNADPIPAISPNDILCPVMTYVFLGIYGALRYTRHDGAGSQATRRSDAGRMRQSELRVKQRRRPSGSRGEASLTRSHRDVRSRLSARSLKGRNSTRTVVVSSTTVPGSRKKGANRSQVAWA